VPFQGYRTWYRVVGDTSVAGPKAPLLVVHGGPGFPTTISAAWPA
jgi:hypothetical protein